MAALMCASGCKDGRELAKTGCFVSCWSVVMVVSVFSAFHFFLFRLCSLGGAVATQLTEVAILHRGL